MTNTQLIRYSKEMSDADYCELAYFLSNRKPDLFEYQIRKNSIGGLGSHVKLTYGNVVVILEDCFDFLLTHKFGVGYCFVYLGSVEYVFTPVQKEQITSVAQKELYEAASKIIRDKRSTMKFESHFADQFRFFEKKTILQRLSFFIQKLKTYLTT